MQKDPVGTGSYAGNARLDGVFESLERTRLNHFTRRFRFEHGLLFREGIDPLTSRHSWLLDRDQLQQSRNDHLMLRLKLLIDNIIQALQNGIDLLLLQSTLT